MRCSEAFENLFLQIFVDFVDFHTTVDLQGNRQQSLTRASCEGTYVDSFVLFFEFSNESIELRIARIELLLTDVDQCRARADLRKESGGWAEASGTNVRLPRLGTSADRGTRLETDR